MQGAPWDLNKLSAWERDVTGKAVSIINWGHFWDNGSGGYRAWSNGTINNARGHGSIPMISWTPEGGDNSRWQLGDIIRGDHDAYIRQFATDAKTWGHPFFLRIMHEMNGSWGYPWQETQNGNQRGEFVQAWRRIVDIFNSVGAGNASFVWCPNIDYPSTTNPSFASLYPGDAYVDWTCLDGYNWGSARSSGWQSFDQVYSYSYNEILKFAPSKPMMIGEFGSVEQGAPAGQSKATWFTDALSTQLPQRYPQIRAAVYFNWPFDGVDWRIETSAAAQDAWRAGIASPYYLANQFGSISGGKVTVP
jgi:beta-mannanase